MKYINLESLRGTDGFEALIAEAEAAAWKAAEEEDPDERKAIIKRNADCWKAFRPHLERLLGRKCWYTESRNSGSDDDVDHFRPKGRVAERPDHGGYWWLAFDWRNLRLSCHRANRLHGNEETGETHGKGDHFPLIEEAERWMSRDQVCRERPTLLDPTDPADPPILTYGIDGRAALSPAYADDRHAGRRLEDSRLYLHLDSPALVEDRASLYGSIATKVEKLDRVADAALDGDADAMTLLKETARELIGLAQAQAAYSRAAEAYIRIYRDREWVRIFVLRNLGDPT